MVLDHLGKHFDRRLEVVIVRRGCFDLGDEILGPSVLDLGLVMNVDVIGRLEEGGIENLLLDGGVNLQRITNLCRQFLFTFAVTRFLELLEPILDLPVVRLEKRNRIFLCLF